MYVSYVTISLNEGIFLGKHGRPCSTIHPWLPHSQVCVVLHSQKPSAPPGECTLKVSIEVSANETAPQNVLRLHHQQNSLFADIPIVNIFPDWIRIHFKICIQLSPSSFQPAVNIQRKESQSSALYVASSELLSGLCCLMYCWSRADRWVGWCCSMKAVLEVSIVSPLTSSPWTTATDGSLE